MPDLSYQETTRLVDSARGGDQVAVEMLFERYLPRVRRMVALRLGKRLAELHEEEDLVQETLMAAFRGLDHFEHSTVGSFRHWLATLAVNRIRDCSRRDSAERRGGGRERPMSAYDSKILTDSVFIGCEPTPEEAANASELADRLETALLALSERDRLLFELRRVAQCSYEEIAAEIGVQSASSARSAVGRALRRLSDELEK